MGRRRGRRSPRTPASGADTPKWASGASDHSAASENAGENAAPARVHEWGEAPARSSSSAPNGRGSGGAGASPASSGD